MLHTQQPLSIMMPIEAKMASPSSRVDLNISKIILIKKAGRHNKSIPNPSMLASKLPTNKPEKSSEINNIIEDAVSKYL
ncbi:MAG: hypothetical protein KA198_04985 [Chitinophagaceae bacterium]|nr:hypothetical protein [Chitinophagaceae bacterium]